MNAFGKVGLYCAKWLVPVLLLTSTPLIQCQTADQFSEGTCAVFLQNGKNLAFVIDSARTTTINGVRAPKTDLTCKVWLPNPGVIAATTGLLDSPSFFLSWNANASGKSWTQSLSQEPTPEQVDSALRGWGQELMNYLAAHQRAAQRYNGEISSLVVAFRSGGKSFLYKERIERYKGKVMRDEEQSVRFPLSDEGDARVFSGSCRHFIRFAGGNRDVEITPDDSSELDRLVKESKALRLLRPNSWEF
jgi:hypothetical protein